MDRIDKFLSSSTETQNIEVNNTAAKKILNFIIILLIFW